MVNLHGVPLDNGAFEAGKNHPGFRAITKLCEPGKSIKRQNPLIDFNVAFRNTQDACAVRHGRNRYPHRSRTGPIKNRPACYVRHLYRQYRSRTGNANQKRASFLLHGKPFTLNTCFWRRFHLRNGHLAPGARRIFVRGRISRRRLDPEVARTTAFGESSRTAARGWRRVFCHHQGFFIYPIANSLVTAPGRRLPQKPFSCMNHLSEFTAHRM